MKINVFEQDTYNIFLYFPVCKRWQALARSSWSGFKKLDFNLDTWSTKQDKNALICMQNIKIFYKVIVRAGKYLTCVKLHSWNFEGHIEYKINHLKVLKLLRGCPNIQELVILSGEKLQIDCYYRNEKCTNARHKIFYYLEPHFKRLTSLTLDLKLFCDTSTEIAILFQNLIKLNSIHLENFKRILKSNCLLNLPLASLKEIMISKVVVDEGYYLKLLTSVISKCVDLQAISIVVYRTSWEPMLEALFLHKNVKHLEILYAPVFNSIDPVKKLRTYFSQLTYLEKLDLSFSNVVNDKLVKVIAANCQNIANLNIMSCDDITDVGISSLSSLKKLRYLKMDCMGDKVICPTWEKMDCFEELSCTFCLKLKCESLCDLVLNKAPNLRMLNVSSCPGMDNRLMDVALEAFKSRDKNKILTVSLYDTEIRPNQKHKESGRLNILKKKKIHNLV